VRHFTVDEANALIPTLTPLLQDLHALHQRMTRAVEEVQVFERRAIQNGHGENTNVFLPDYSLEAIHSELNERLGYLDRLGIQLKDIENGILDFPTRMHGRDVYLCWRLGEETVAHWHEIESGFAGRRPL
jgi:hypothetical protein